MKPTVLCLGGEILPVLLHLSLSSSLVCTSQLWFTFMLLPVYATGWTQNDPCCCKPAISALLGAVSAQQHPVSSPCQQEWSRTALPMELVGTWEGWAACMGQPGPKAAGSWCFLQSVEVTELLAQLLKVRGDVLADAWVRGATDASSTSRQGLQEDTEARCKGTSFRLG